MPNDNVQTLTGHAVVDAPVRNALPQISDFTSASAQEAQSTWGPRPQGGDNVTTQMTQTAAGKCNGLPSLEIEGLDSNMGPFDPNFDRYNRDGQRFHDFEYDYKNGSGKDAKNSGKDGKGGCPQFEERDYTSPHGSPVPGKPDPRHNPYQGGGEADMHAVPGYEKPEFNHKPGFEKPEFNGQPGHFEKRKEDVQMQRMKDKLDGSKCGGTDGTRSETPTTQRQLTESERVIEQKIIEQKLREAKLRERYRF